MPVLYICDACIAAAEQAGSGRANTTQFSVTSRTSLRRRCAFCGKTAGKDRALLAAAAGNICGDCLQTCRQIVDNQA